jgi:competence protein ComEC
VTPRPQDVRLLVPALTAWAMGAATLGVSPAVRVAAGLGLLALASALMVGRHRVRRRPGRHAAHQPGPGAVAVLLNLVCCGLVLAASGIAAARHEVGTVHALADQGAVARLTGVVVSDPRELPPGPHGGPGKVMLRLSTRSVAGRGERTTVDSGVLIFAAASWRSVHRGEQVELSGRLTPAQAGDDVVATVSALGPPMVTGPASTLARAAERVRAGLRRAVQPLRPDARGLLPGLVDGDESLLAPDLAQAMRDTGLTHLSAVSGSNTTLVGVLALAAGRAAGLGRRSRLVAAAVALAGFVVLARPDPSVLRAAAMGLVGMLALAGARRTAATPALSAAIVVLLVADPWMARAYGFALSVLATLGLLLLAPGWSDALARGLPRPLAVALAVPLSAQALTSPVLVLLSAQLSLVSLPANLLAAPLVPPATVLGLAAAMADLVDHGLAGFMAHLGGWPCLVIAAIARRLAGVQGGRLPWWPGPPGAVALAALTLGLIALGRYRPSPTAHPYPAGSERVPARRRTALAAVTAVALAVVLPLPTSSSWLPLPVPRAAWPPRGWVLTVCDVGQGDALVLSTGPHRAVLVDAGPNPESVDRCLRRLAVRQLDVVVLTHFHADHVDGLAGAIRGRRVGRLVGTVVDEPRGQAQRVRQLAARVGLNVEPAVAGSSAQYGPVRWRVVWPERVIRAGSVPNNASVVLLIETQGLRLLLLGDVEQDAARVIDRRLRDLPDGPVVDVLKVAHHGSSKQDAGLLAGTRPRLALISVGEENDYGHPAPSLLRALAALGSVVGRTDQQGDLAVVARNGSLLLAATGRQPPRGSPGANTGRPTARAGPPGPGGDGKVES